MLNKILKKFGYVIVRVSIMPSLQDRIKSMEENQLLKTSVSELQAKLDATVARHAVVDCKIGDPTPVDSNKRRVYVSSVAGFHQDYLGEKISQMISNIHADLESPSNSRDEDLALKGAIYALQEMNIWGNAMINEHLSYQTEDDISSPDETNK